MAKVVFGRLTVFFRSRSEEGIASYSLAGWFGVTVEDGFREDLKDFFAGEVALFGERWLRFDFLLFELFDGDAPFWGLDDIVVGRVREGGEFGVIVDGFDQSLVVAEGELRAKETESFFEPIGDAVQFSQDEGKCRDGLVEEVLDTKSHSLIVEKLHLQKA